ncbi:MAG TPA: Npt1/Npt2 family nucleotide transporter, partial [Anaerolineales bacterium]
MTTSQTVSSARPSRLAALFSVEPGEGRPVASMAGLNFSVSAAFVLVQTSAFALFIETFSAHALPYAYFSVAILSSLIAYAFLQLSRRVSFVSGLYINLAFLTGVCIVFWVGLRTSAARWFIFLLPFWFQTLVILANLVVWHLASHLFHVRQAKRVFGLIVAGNWVANIIGGVLVGSILGLIPAADLYLLAAIAIALSAVVLRAILARHFQQAPPAVPVAAPGSGKRAGFTSVLKHRYARLIFIYTVLWWLELFVLENVFFHQVESQFESSGSLATFLGRQLAVMGVIALFTTSFLTSRVARRYGLRNGLLVMPVLVGVTVMLLVVGGTLGWGTDFLFWMATIARTLNIALGFSISQAMGTLLFQPLLGSLRSAAQTVAEGIMQPLAIGLAGVVLLIFNTTLNLDAVGLSLIFLVVAVPWLWSILQLARRYPLAMGEALRRRSLGDSTVPLFDASSIALLRRHLRDSRPGSALYAMNQLEQLAPQEWARILLEELPQLLAHPSADVRVESLRRVLMLRVTEALPILLGRLEYEQVADVRSMLIRVLATFGNSRSAAEVRKALNASERVVRQGAILGVLSGNGSPDAALALESL